MTRKVRIGVLACAGAAALVAAAAASAHATMSPPVTLAKKLQQFTLSVPTEEAGATTTKIVLDVPKGFAIDSYEPSPGWTRTANASSVTWAGGRTPTDEDSVFRFNASTTGAQTYTFDVKQYYSDGKVVDWDGPESSDSPAPTIDTVSSFGGGSSTLTIVALALAAVALLVSVAGLLGRREGRELA